MVGSFGQNQPPAPTIEDGGTRSFDLSLVKKLTLTREWTTQVMKEFGTEKPNC